MQNKLVATVVRLVLSKQVSAPGEPIAHKLIQVSSRSQGRPAAHRSRGPAFLTQDTVSGVYGANAKSAKGLASYVLHLAAIDLLETFGLALEELDPRAAGAEGAGGAAGIKSYVARSALSREDLVQFDLIVSQACPGGAGDWR